MTLLIENLVLEIIIGILPSEREKKQKIILNAELDYDYQGEYLNYVEIVEFLTFELQNNQYQLLEVALQDLHSKLRQNFTNLQNISLSIQKPEILKNCIVGAKLKT